MIINTKKLRNDIENKHFNIFPKTNYYKFIKTTKKELVNILTDICNEYNIKNARDQIKILTTLPLEKKS